MQQKTISLQTQQQEDIIGMDNLPELPVDASELEQLLEQLGADITHPVQSDPVATLNGEVVGFWVV